MLREQSVMYDSTAEGDKNFQCIGSYVAADVQY
jgi:hypothetical protein